MKLYLYPPIAVSVSVPPIAYTDPVTGNTPVTPSAPLPVYQAAAPADKAKLDFSASSVTNAAWVQLIASTANDSKLAQIFMSSGEPLEFAFGAPASEVAKGYIFPGGNGTQGLVIPAGTRVSVKAVNAVTINTGLLLVNFLG